MQKMLKVKDNEDFDWAMMVQGKSKFNHVGQHARNTE